MTDAWADLWGRLSGAVNRYARVGLASLPRQDRSARYAFNLMCLIGAIASVFYMSFYLAMGLPELAAFSMVVGLVGLLPWAALRSERLAMLLGLVFVGTGMVGMTWLAGRDALLHVFILAVVVNGTILRGARAPLDAAVATVASLALIVWCHATFPMPALAARIAPGFVALLAAVNLVALGVMFVGALLALARQVAAAQEALAAEHARSEALLDTLLPADIARRLKAAPGEIIADDLPGVTILFADIVDFTPRAQVLPPEEVVRFLNRIFTEFDRLTARFGLEKIKTIGDAYMVAAGMPVARADHARAVADMALAMLEATHRLSAEAGQGIEVRIGFHSGPAIAGVIGTQKVFYDVWGDTVNTASRMESHGEPGRIQLTLETRDRLGDSYLCEPRGTVAIKGKGLVETCWLVGRA